MPDEVKHEFVNDKMNPNDICEKCKSKHCSFEDLGGYAYPVIERTCKDCGCVEKYVDLYR